MATPIANRLTGHVWFLCTANTTISLSDMAHSAGENVAGASVVKIIFTGPWTIYRGANVVWQTANTSFTHDFAEKGITLSQDAGASVVCNTASGTASLLICLNKQSSANGSPVV